MTEGKIRTETHDHVFKIIIHNPAKKNAFSPAMMEQLSDALTELHNTESLWVGVICAEGKDFTAGLDMPKFFGPTAEKRNFKEGNVDVFGLQRRCKKPDRVCRAGHRLHHRHRTDAGGRHRRCRR
jgi:enoyl-CoA hydratase